MGGLWRHYGVATKLVLNCLTTVFLLGCTEEIAGLARVATRHGQWTTVRSRPLPAADVGT